MFGVCLKTSWFGVCKWAAYSRPVSRRGRCVYVSVITYLQRWTAGWRNRVRELVFSRMYGSQMHWKWDETARCYNSLAALACHRRRSMARAAWPWYRTNLVLRTAQTNLTSAAPQRPQHLRCGQKMKTLTFSLTSKQSTGLPARRRYSYSSTEKMKDSVNTEGYL